MKLPRATRLIITGTSEVLLEYGVKPLVAQFLSERGLELSHEKTRITRVEDGFDFLGQTVRRFRDGKVVIKPSKKSVKTFLADLEGYCRHLVTRESHRLYIICGPAGKGGAGKNGHRNTIAGGKITVPASCWKVVMVLPEGGARDDVSKVFARTRLIAVIMPNDGSVKHDWPRYRTSVKKVEELTGYTFFDNVPAEVIDPLKEKVDEVMVHPSRSRSRHKHPVK